MTLSRMRSLGVLCLALLFMERPVDAYLDPGSGSMFLQLLLGGVAGAGVILKLYWHRLTARFRSRQPGDSTDGRNAP